MAAWTLLSVCVLIAQRVIAESVHGDGAQKSSYSSFEAVKEARERSKVMEMKQIHQDVSELRDFKSRRRILQSANELNGFSISITPGSYPREVAFDNTNPQALTPNTDTQKESACAGQIYPGFASVVSQSGDKSGYNEKIGYQLTADVLLPKQSKETFKIIKISGDGGVTWAAVSYKDKGFIVLFSNSKMPAEIILPGGQHTVLLDAKGREAMNIEEFIHLTIVFGDSSYLALEQDFLKELQKLPTSNWQQQIPPVTHHSHGIVNADSRVGSNIIENTVIEVLDSLSYRNLMLAARTSNQEITTTAWSSERGYLNFDFPSETQSRKRIPHLVCIHCLFNMTKNDTELEEVFGEQESLANFTDLTVTSSDNSERLWRYYKRNKDQLPRNVILSTEYFQSKSLFVELKSGEHFELDMADLKLLVNFTDTKKLKAAWLEEVSLTGFKYEENSAQLFSCNNKLFVVNEKAVEEYLNANKASEGVDLQTNLTAKVSEEHYFKGGLRLNDSAIQSLFKEVASIDRLFLESSKDVLSRAWPFIYVPRADGSVSQYYLNVELLKFIHGVPRPYFEYSTIESVEDKAVEKMIDKFDEELIPVDTSMPSNASQRTASVLLFTTTEQQVVLTKSMLSKVSVILPQLFTSLEVIDNRKPTAGESFVVIGKRAFYFKESELVSIIDRNDFPTTEIMAGVLKALGMDPGRSFTILVNETHSLEGTCVGKYLDMTSCLGTFSGNLMYNESGNETLTIFKRFNKCEGTSNGTGCFGSYSDAIKTDYMPMRVKSSTTSNFDFKVITGESDLNSTGDKSEGVAYGRCIDWLDMDDKKGKNCNMHVDRSKNVPPLVQDIDCKGILDIRTLECEGPMKSMSCEGVTDTDRNLVCVGKSIVQECSKGGNPTGCSEDSPENKIIMCDVLWNGEVCDKNPLLVPVTETSYAYGYCRGKVLEGSRCVGTFLGTYTECGQQYNADKLCPEKDSTYFVCTGVTNPSGCTGDMNSYYSMDNSWRSSKLSIRGEEHDYVTKDPGFFEYSTISKTSRFNYSKENDVLKVNSTASCYKKLSISSGTCTGFSLERIELNLEESNSPETTRIECEADYALNNGTCIEGEYTFETCLGDSRSSADVICNGTYYGIVCASGGVDKSCRDEGQVINQTGCTGVWNGYSCKGDHSKLYIKINETDYLIGQCDGEYNGNLSCTGNFYDGQMYICNQNPYLQDNFLNACGENRIIGNCSGFLNGTGCYGHIKGFFEIEGETYSYISSRSSHYDFTSVNGTTTLTQLARLTDERSSEGLRCMRGFNPATKTCEEVEYTYINKDSNPDKAGVAEAIYWSCPKDTDIAKLECPENATLTKCEGSYLDNPKHKMQCLGNLTFKFCARGGDPEKCNRDSVDNKYIECLGKHWNGTDCLESQSSSKQEMLELDPITVKTVDGEGDIKIARFVFEEYSIKNPIVARLEIWNSTIDQVTLTSGAQTTNGSFTNLVLNKRNNIITMTTGNIVKLTLEDLQLDNMNFSRLEKCLDCQAVQIMFKSLKLVDAVIQDMQTANCTIDTLQVGRTYTSAFLYDDFDLSMGLMNVTLSNITLNLPAVSIETMGTSANDDRPSIETEIKPENIPLYMASFRLKLMAGGDLASDNFLEFPVYELRDLAINQLKVGNFVLASRVLNRQNSEPERKKKSEVKTKS